MKAPYRWRKAIVPAAYDVLFYLGGFVGFAILLPRIVRSLGKLWSGRPVVAAVVSGVGVALVIYAFLELRTRLLLFVGVIRFWRRQRTGVWPGGRPLHRRPRRPARR